MLVWQHYQAVTELNAEYYREGGQAQCSNDGMFDLLGWGYLVSKRERKRVRTGG